MTILFEEDVLNPDRILNGKIEIQNRISIDKTSEEQKGKETLSLIYTPGVAFAAKKISNDINLAYNYTSKWNNVAIVCDGSRILRMQYLIHSLHIIFFSDPIMIHIFGY